MKRLYKMRNAGMLLAGMITFSAHAVITVTPAEMVQKTQWVQQNLLTATNLPPFSFTYSGQASSAVLPSWARAEQDTILDPNRTQHVITWTNNFLQVQCVAVEYNDYPMAEWTVYLKAIGPRSTPILQGIQGLDITLSRTNGPEFVLNGTQGDSATASSYEPYQVTLGPATVNNFFSPADSGKSCDGANGWPYYDLQMPGGGIIMAIGWAGQWASSFTRDAGNDLHIQAGQQLTYLVLNPGEEIRTPLIAMLFWQGTNVVRAQNIWRHWYMAHEIPLVNGKPPSTIIAVGGDSINDINNYLQASIRPDILWRDADNELYTWYPVAPYADTTADWIYTGTWVVDTNSYPNGFSPVSAAAHALGMKFLLWFEPERVGNPYSWLATNHPEWLLPGTSTTVGSILNEGNAAAFNWLTNHITGMIVSNGIDWYREDMNGGGPLPTWQNNDASDRQGITENFYVQGHLAYWDALLAMNPGLRIDCCGSGGRRNDLEAMRRAVPLWRSDFASGGDMASLADGNQCLTYGSSAWLPFQGTSCDGFWDPYSFRSSYMASFVTGGLSPANSAAQQQAITECKKIAPIMLNGDYYPLTPYSQDETVWVAWQFDRPDTGEGCVQIFRRTNSPVASMTFQLQGLNPTQIYDVSNFDTGNLGWYTGSDLMSPSITVQLNPRQSAILYYTNITAIAQLPVDSSLSLWLNAGTLTGSAENQTTPGVLTVPAWTSSDNYRTIFAVPLIGEAANDPSNHTPQLVTFTNNGAVFQAVQFRQDCDPITPDFSCTPSGHLADRLWQTNNLGASDPTAIGPTNDMTLIVVYKNDDLNSALGPSQCIVAKRGPSECPFEFGFDDSALKSMYVVYAGNTAYDSGNTYPAAPEWGIMEMNVTSGGQLTFREYFASQGGWQNYTTSAARSSSGASPVRTAYWSAASTPMSLGFHCQSIDATAAGPFGNGEDERFGGGIAEVALYNRSLSNNELACVENYLLTKYFYGLPQINIGIQAGQITLTWTNPTAILQSASTVTGPWSNVTGATNPYPVTTTGSQMFFRLEQ